MKTLISFLIALNFAGLCYGQQWHWRRNDDLLNPSHIYTKGMNCPFTGDFDRDGDIDLIVGCRGGVLQYYENIGTPDSAIWQMDEDYFSSIALDTSFAPQPSLEDLDGDGVDELFISLIRSDWGIPAGVLYKYLNQGTQQNPVWVADGFDIGYDLQGQANHQFVDFDSDGDLDLLMVEGVQPIYYENLADSTGQNTFRRNDDIIGDLQIMGYDDFGVTLVDFGNDGMFELVVSYDVVDGFDMSRIVILYNTGTVENPVWQQQGYDYGGKMFLRTVFADFDDDSDLDMLIGGYYDQLFYNENIGSPDSTLFRYQEDGLCWGPPYHYWADNICLVDYDNDGDRDLVYCYKTIVWDYREDMLGRNSATGTSTNGAFYFDYTRSFTGFEGFAWYYNLNLSDGDLNGDGYPEMAFRASSPCYYINDSGNGFDWTNYDIMAIDDNTFNSFPELGDFNGDGLTDMLVRQSDVLQWLFYQNTGTQYVPAWTRATNWLEGLDEEIFQYRAAKIDDDDRVDLIGIDENWHMHGFINIGSGDEVAFAYVPTIFEGWEDYPARYFDCADLDNDGDDDIVVDSAGALKYIENQTRVGIDESDNTIPQNLSLLQNYPNPFNASTNISYTLDKAGEVKLELFDVLGRRVATILDEQQSAGQHYITWKPEQGIPSGIYFYKLTTPDRSMVRKMNYLK